MGAILYRASRVSGPSRLASDSGRYRAMENCSPNLAEGATSRDRVACENEAYTLLMEDNQRSQNRDDLHNSNADLAVPAPKKFKAGALKGRLIVPDYFLDPDPELESLFYDGQILSGVPDEELLTWRPGPRDPVETAKVPK